VQVHAYPWATVAIDGIDQGTTPFLKPLPVSEGKHRIVFTHPAFGPVEKSIDAPVVDDAHPVPVAVDFCSEGKPSSTPMINCGDSP
jgi:hypothetical protein